MPRLSHRFSYEDATSRLKKLEKHEFSIPISGKINVGLIFLGSYEMGMSNLGFLTVHRLTGKVSGIGIERFFPELINGHPLRPPFYTFETGRPLGDLDVLAFSISYEGDFDRLPSILKPLGIPLPADERQRRRFPLIIVGGAGVTANPFALSRIADVIVTGEAETIWPAILKRLSDEKQHVVFASASHSSAATHSNIACHSQSTGIKSAAACLNDIPGVWIPALSSTPNPAPLPHNVAYAPAYTHIVTPSNVFGGAYLIEVMRGCPRHCTFCVSRVIYHPPRTLPAASFADWLSSRPWIKELGLIAPSLFDHPEIEEILKLCADRKLRLHNSSVKWERLSEQVLKLLHLCGVNGLTLAPESGSPKVRATMGKPLQEEAFFATINRIGAHGFKHLKLYFIVGFPGESQADLEATAEFLMRASKIAYQAGLSLVASFSGFVPKRGVSAAKGGFIGAAELKRRFTWLKRFFQSNTHLQTRFESPEEIARQAYLAQVGPDLLDQYLKEASEWAVRGKQTSSKMFSSDF